MPKLSQKSFVSGQYDRIAQNQESINGGGIVASGLSYSKNNLSSDKGELRKRLGTKFLKQLDGATVIVPFRNKENDDILLFSEGKLDILEYTEGGLSTQNYITYVDTKVEKTWNSDTTDGYTVSVTYRGTSGNAAYHMFDNPYYPGTSASEMAAHPFVAGYEYLGDMAGGGIHIPNTFFAKLQLPSNGVIGKFTVIFAASHQSGNVPYESGYTGYTNAVIQYSDDNINWTPVQTIISSRVGNAPYYAWRFPTIRNGNTYTIDTSIFENIIMYDVILNEFVGQHLYWRVYFTNPVDGGTRLYSPKLNIQFYTRSETQYSTIYTDITNLKNIKYSQSGNDMKLVDGEHTPKTISLGAGYSYSNFTPSAPNNFWTTWGNPSCVQYCQNRLWFGGFSAFPTTVVASKFNNISDFSYSTPAQTNDGLELKCNQLKSKISNLTAGQNILYCFSQDGISNIDGGSNGLANNANVEFLLKNRMPAGDSTPAFKDDIMLYSSSDGTKLYGVDFDLLVNRFQVSDLAKYAKDITKAKITELHYVNNESKLVYGLMEDGSMFALLYEKGQYQGFFPLDFGGTVYDIAPIKVGRNYKLLMVVFRDGNWYLEEKLDAGNYIDTSTPRLTDEDKKWATYDNLENNIALDCYQTYDESFDCEISISDESALISNKDLTQYVGKTIMLNSAGEKDFVVATIKSVQTLYAWNTNTSLDGRVFCYTHNAHPASGDLLYDDYGVVIEEYDLPGNYVPADVYPGHITVLGPVKIGGIRQAITVYEDPDSNRYVVSIEIQARRGTTTSYSKIYPEFTEFEPNLPQVSDVAVISEGRYFNATKPDENGKIYLPAPCHKVIYGVPYESVAIIKLQAPYESLKNIAQVDLSVIDSTHLEVGTSFEDTQNIEKIDDSSYYDLTRITMNDTYRLVLSDTPETTKNLILRSNKGVPFTVIAVDMYVNYSNLGGD